MNFAKQTRSLAVAGTVALSTLAFTPDSAQAEWSGNIGVYSQYVLRGITNAPEDGNAALQGGFDYAHDSGFYAGYWASSLGYNSADYSADGFENDFYLGFGGGSDFTYDVGLIYYKYINIDDADAPELAVSLGYGPFSVGANYLLDDVAWGNKGDTYWTLNYEAELPSDFTLGATYGHYTYKDSGEFINSTENDSAFRHFSLTLAHPIGNTGADMSVSYIKGGEDRDANDQDDAVVLGVSYGFDI